MTNYEDFISRKQKEYGEKFDPSDLDARFIEFFNSQDRIKVQSQDYVDDVHYGIVGVTTGWKPCFLLIHDYRCQGSGSLLDSNYKILAVSRDGKYRALKAV